jgi:four helix bundle protein
MFIKHFEDIEAWQSSRILIKKIYLLTRASAFAKDYGLRDQIQRAAVSIMLNIAEGFDSKSNQSFINFLKYSYRSASEVKSILYVALDLEYINQDNFKELRSELDRVQNLIGGLIRSLKNK